MDCGEKMNDCGNRWVRLNVGGTIFQTTRTTLGCYPDSFLHKLVREDSGLKTDRDESGAYLIDRNPKYFAPVLDFVRHGELVMDQNLAEEGVMMEADFFGLPKLVELVKLRMQKNPPYPEHWVKLNVSGTIFHTARSTLTRYPNSFLDKLVKEDSDLKTDGSGVYFIDRNPKYFTTVLEYMRHGELVMDQNLDEEGVLREATFFGVPGLAYLMQRKVDERQLEEREKKNRMSQSRSTYFRYGRGVGGHIANHIRLKFEQGFTLDKIVTLPSDEDHNQGVIVTMLP